MSPPAADKRIAAPDRPVDLDRATSGSTEESADLIIADDKELAALLLAYNEEHKKDATLPAFTATYSAHVKLYAEEVQRPDLYKTYHKVMLACCQCSAYQTKASGMPAQTVLQQPEASCCMPLV